MDELERKLKEYYNSIEPNPAFMERLKALEHSPEAKPKPRKARRYLLPAAAALTAAVALGASWTYLRISMPGNAPEPGSVAFESPVLEKEKENYVNSKPVSAAPDSAPAAAAEPASPAEAPESEAPAAQKPKAPAVQTPNAPAEQEPEEAPAAQAPAESTPPEPEPQSAPPEPDNTLKNDPPAGDPEPPEDDPPKKPEEKPEHPEEKPDNTGTVPIIFAQYQSTGSQETLTLSNLSTGETAVIDVTGLLPPPEEMSLSDPSVEEEPVAYSGECSAFGWSIHYALVQLGSEVYAVAEAGDPD